MTDRGRFDWLVELGGAFVLAAAAGFAAFKLAPLFEAAPSAAMAGSSLAAFALAFGAIRTIVPEQRQFAIAAFPVAPIDQLDELLLDQAYEEPLLLDYVYEEADDVLLLEDVLGAAKPDSRVVHLFAASAMPTPGQLQARIDRHLAGEPGPAMEPALAPAPDASDALYAALAELRRSLR